MFFWRPKIRQRYIYNIYNYIAVFFLMDPKSSKSGNSQVQICDFYLLCVRDSNFFVFQSYVIFFCEFSKQEEFSRFLVLFYENFASMVWIFTCITLTSLTFSFSKLSDNFLIIFKLGRVRLIVGVIL